MTKDIHSTKIKKSSKKRKKENPLLRCFLCICIFCILVVTGFKFITKSLSIKSDEKLHFQEKGNVKYSVCLKDNNEYLYSTSAIIEDVNLLSNLEDECMAKFRYRQNDNPVKIKKLDNNELLVTYPDGIKAVTPGQVCVLYKDDLCIGSGIVKEVQKNGKELWYL